MKKNSLRVQFYGLAAFILILSVMCYAQDVKEHSEETSVLNNAYLGQKLPGLKPEVFAPDVLSGKYSFHGFPTFSPDGKEIYFSVLPPKIMFMKYENGEWTEAKRASFSSGNNITSANFSLDGKRIYYQSMQHGGEGGVDIWYVERTSRGWST